MKNFLILFLLGISTILYSQNIIESCKTGQPLINALQSIYTPDSTLGYGPARDTLYSKIDNNGLELSGIYTGFTVSLIPGEDPSITVFQNENGLNAEHVYPQSKGARDEPGRSDMYNLFPSKVNVNSARGSCIFGDIEDTDTEFWFLQGNQQSQIPTLNIDAYSEKDEESCVFEPRESVKGDMARAVFYFYTIYQSKAEQADPNFFSNQKATLLEWHQADPVSEKEIHRSALIASYQGNFNPYILDRTLAERAFFKADASYEEGDTNCLTTSTFVVEKVPWIQLATNLVQTEIKLTSTQKEVNLLLTEVNGRLVKKASFDFYKNLPVADLQNGYYFLFAQSEGLQEVFKILVIH